jgi:hypothetical protein
MIKVEDLFKLNSPEAEISEEDLDNIKKIEEKIDNNIKNKICEILLDLKDDDDYTKIIKKFKYSYTHGDIENNTYLIYHIKNRYEKAGWEVRYICTYYNNKHELNFSINESKLRDMNINDVLNGD